MADVDQLTALGQMLATALVSSYGSDVPGGSLVFLPVGVSVADDIVQGGVVNPTQLQQWLGINFDFPFTISSGDAAVIAQEDAHGTASFIYSLAVTQAQPLGTPSDPVWQRVAGELSAARQVLGPAPSQMNFICEPDDWPNPGAPYWTTFDSAQVASTTTPPAPPPPVPQPPFWQIRHFEPLAERIRPIDRVEEPIMLRSRTYAASAIPASALASAYVLEDAPVMQRSAVSAPASVPVAEVAYVRPQFDVAQIMNGSTTVTNVTTSATSSITIHLLHQCVRFGRYTAGQPCWNGGLLADPGWYVPGFSAGGILPAPVNADAGTVYALPVAMIVVSQLKVSGQWSQDALTALSAPGGSVGPLALFGAVPSSASDGITISFEHDGMQVVALLCSPLPVIPASGAPTATTSTPASTTSPSATTPSTTSASATSSSTTSSAPTSDSSTTGADGASGNVATTTAASSSASDSSATSGTADPIAATTPAATANAPTEATPTAATA